MISTVEMDLRVLEKELCVNCGACEGMCPYWHSFEGRMLHDFDCSREEGRCVAFCPRMPTDIVALRHRFFEDTPVTEELGPFRALYMARAADPAIRAMSQHGGAMTALVSLALKEGFIDAAVMTKARGGLEPQGVLAATKEEILACRGSSFQIPASLAVLNAALADGRYQNIGVVGTPCKTLAVYKMKAKPIPERDNNADHIGMVFGLFCGWGLDWNGLSQLIGGCGDAGETRHIDIPPSKYHCMTVAYEKGQKEIDLDEVTPLVRKSCRFCTDMTAEFSDISIGGARSAEGWETDKGWNQIIVRSQKGTELLALAKKQGVLEFKDVPEGNLERLKKASLNKKRTGIANIAALTGSGESLAHLAPPAKAFARLEK
jgi:coenzyme F420 hydrogenase subunit beta